MPEYINGEKVIPDETYVLVGYYKSKEQLDWILKNNLYNFRTGTNKGSLPLGPREVGAKLLILHGDNDYKSTKIYQLLGEGPKIFSREDLIKKKYLTVPAGDI